MELMWPKKTSPFLCYVDFWGFLLIFLEGKCRDKTTSAHSVSVKETIEVGSVQVKGATAYEISGAV